MLITSLVNDVIRSPSKETMDTLSSLAAGAQPDLDASGSCRAELEFTPRIVKEQYVKVRLTC